MLHESMIGRGGYKPERSAISGKALTPEDVYTTLNGYKVGVKAVEWRNLSAAEKTALQAEWLKDLPAAAASVSSDAQERPAYEALSLEDLKTVANERGIDITGRRTKADIANALHAADVAARFTPPPEALSSDAPLALDNTSFKGE